MSIYLITGASRGIGLEFIVQIIYHGTFLEYISWSSLEELLTSSLEELLTKRLLEDNKANKVIAASRSPVTALQELQKKNPERLTLIQLDVTDNESVKAAAAEVAKKYSHIDYLINNAGTGTFKSTDHLTAEEFLQDLNINAVGVFRVTKEFLPLVKKGNKKVIVGLSSTLSSIALTPKYAGPFVAYRPSKAALNALFATLQEEYKKDGISFIPIHPGWVETDLGSQLGAPPLKPTESVRSMLASIHKHKTGDEIQLLNYDGTALPW